MSLIALFVAIRWVHDIEQLAKGKPGRWRIVGKTVRPTGAI
ncbi:MAG: hypothetical protein R2845_06750 [Thermomicrobiales bacterium]